MRSVVCSPIKSSSSSRPLVMGSHPLPVKICVAATCFVLGGKALASWSCVVLRGSARRSWSPPPPGVSGVSRMSRPVAWIVFRCVLCWIGRPFSVARHRRVVCPYCWCIAVISCWAVAVFCHVVYMVPSGVLCIAMFGRSPGGVVCSCIG